MSDPEPRHHPLANELRGFLIAVFVGSVGGLLAGQLLAHWVHPATATNLALAAGTTITAATHARLVHQLPMRAILPRVAMAAPLAYVIMRGVHGLLGP